MRAVVSTGTDWRIDEIDPPAIRDGQVLVAVRAVALNNADQIPASAGTVAGYEFAGEIVATGSQVAAWHLGDWVMGTSPAAFAEQVAVDARLVAPIPAGVSWPQAAALPTGLLTEYGSLQRAGFHPGDTVLITAASSGIAMIGLQLVRALGGVAIAAARSDRHQQLLHSLGARHVIIGTGAALTDPVLAVTDRRGVDLVLDHVGSDTLAAALPATAVGGTVVNVGQLGQDTSELNLSVLTGRQLRLLGVSYGFTDPDQIGSILSALRPQVLPLVAAGAIRPVIAGIFPFAQPGAALAAARAHAGPGKLVLELDGSAS